MSSTPGTSQRQGRKVKEDLGRLVGEGVQVEELKAKAGVRWRVRQFGGSGELTAWTGRLSVRTVGKGWLERPGRTCRTSVRTFS